MSSAAASPSRSCAANPTSRPNRDAERLREKLHEAGYEGFPNVLVEARVCRPELLCETEALAVLRRTIPIVSGGG
jgi:hypothetical protein